MTLTSEIKRHAVTYWLYFKQFWRTRLIYKADFLLSSFTQMLNLVTSLAFLTLIFTQVENINGWTFNEMLFLAGFGGVAMNLHHVFLLNIYYVGDDYIITGDLDRFLVRPLNVLYQIYADNIRDENLPKMITNFALIFYAANQMGLNIFTVERILYGVPALISATLTFAAIYLFVSSFAFWTGKSRPLVWIIFRLSDFRRYPYTIYMTPIKILLVTIVPLAFASFFPATFFLEKEGWEMWQIASIIVGPISYTLAYSFWKFGLSNYSSTGS